MLAVIDLYILGSLFLLLYVFFAKKAQTVAGSKEPLSNEYQTRRIQIFMKSVLLCVRVCVFITFIFIISLLGGALGPPGPRSLRSEPNVC